MTIRRATGEEMLALWRAQGVKSSPSTAQYFYENLSSGNAIFWTIESEGEFIGELYAFRDIVEDRDFADGEDTAYLCAFRVRREYRGQGLGTRLMQAALEELKSEGFRHATIGAGEERNLRLYRRMGFTREIKECFLDPCARDERMQPVPEEEPFWLLSKEL